MQQKKFEKAVVIGAGHGIGLSIAKELLRREPEIKIYASYRNPEKAQELLELNDKIMVFQLDPCVEGDLEKLAKTVSADPTNLGLVINCVAWLHTEDMKPEKKSSTDKYDPNARIVSSKLYCYRTYSKIFSPKLSPRRRL